MAHLGADVAAFVDGQLTEAQLADAERHLRACARCREAVDDQRRLKERMGGARLPAPPAELQDVLAGIAHAPPRRHVAVPRLVLAGAALLGVSAVVLGVAYLIGDGDPEGDPVAPGYAALLAAFTPTPSPAPVPDPPAQPTSTAQPTPEAAVTPEQLESHGWPCPEKLGDDLVRDHIDVTPEAVSVFYSNGTELAQLHEQPGRLDKSALTGVTSAQFAGTRVWIAETDPAVITWQAPGFVLTLITNLDRDRWEDVIAGLPSSPEPDAGDRVGDGLDRMADWVP